MTYHSGWARTAAAFVDYVALVDERLRRACEAASASTPPDAPLGSLLASPDPKVVFWMLIELRDSIHKVHLEIKSLCGGGGSPFPADAAFRPRAVAAYLGLWYVTQIGDAVIAPHPDTLFLLLRMYSPLADLFDLSLVAFLPTLEQLSVESRDVFSVLFHGTLLMLRTTIKTTFSMLVSRIAARSAEHAGTSGGGGGVDEITSYLFKYINLLLDHSSLLNVILVSDNPEQAGMESLKDVMVSLISSLDASLQDKSRLYQQHGLQWLFMANNTHHVLKQVESSEMKHLLGDAWILKRQEKLDDYIVRYIGVSWQPLISCLQTDDRDEHVNRFSIPLCFGRRPMSALTRKLTRFSLEFERPCSTHMPWKVEDAQLRKRMRGSVAEILVPAYRDFLEKQSCPLELMRFSPEEIEEQLSELYEG